MKYAEDLDDHRSFSFTHSLEAGIVKDEKLNRFLGGLDSLVWATARNASAVRRKTVNRTNLFNGIDVNVLAKPRGCRYHSPSLG